MISRWAVELYFFSAAGCYLAALLMSLAAIRAQQEGSAWIAVLVVAAGILSVMALIAADVRQRSLPVIRDRLYKNQAS